MALNACATVSARVVAWLLREVRQYTRYRTSPMRHTTTLMLALLLESSLAMGCSAKEESRDGARDKAMQETKEAAQAVADYAYAQKAEFVAKMKLELAEIQEELTRLSEKVEKTTGEAKADAKIKLDAVRERWARAKERLAAAENATESNWNDMKIDFQEAYREMKGSFDETRRWLSDKIHP